MLKEYKDWVPVSEKLCKEAGLDLQKCNLKMKYLTICSLAQQCREIPIQTLKTDLDINEEEIENFVVDKIIDARIDDENDVVVVHSFTKRYTDSDQWNKLGSQLDDLKFAELLNLIRPK